MCVTFEFIQLSLRQGKYTFTIITHMFRAVGVILILWYLSHTISQSFLALDRALTAVFGTLEASAVASQKNF